MNAAELLAKLDGTRSSGRDSWVARCPAHADRNPSLSIRQVPGRILLNCFGGCAADEVVRALNLEMADLFEHSHANAGNAIRAPGMPAMDALMCLSDEVNLAMIYASDMACGETLTDTDRQRLATMAARFFAAIEICRGWS